MRVAREQSCAILGVLHLNPWQGKGNGPSPKSRGHLGSQLDRKAAYTLTLERKEEVITCYSTKARGRPLFANDGVSFAWDESQSLFQTTEAVAGNSRLSEALEAARAILKGGEATKATEFQESLRGLLRCSLRTARRLQDDLEGVGHIKVARVKGKTSLIYLNNNNLNLVQSDLANP